MVEKIHVLDSAEHKMYVNEWLAKFVFVQIILAIGNYMNSAKRGAVYGFKLQSLDMVSKNRSLFIFKQMFLMNCMSTCKGYGFVNVYEKSRFSIVVPIANYVNL